MAQSLLVKRGERQHSVQLLADSGDRIAAVVDGRPVELKLHALPDGRLAVISENARRIVRIFEDAGRLTVLHGTDQRAFEVQDERAAWLASAGGKKAGGGKIKASMPGRVVRVAVQAGDTVADGAVVCVLEAMKMENDVRALGGGVVKQVAVQVGQSVETGELLVLLEPPA